MRRAVEDEDRAITEERPQRLVWLASVKNVGVSREDGLEELRIADDDLPSVDRVVDRVEIAVLEEILLHRLGRAGHPASERDDAGVSRAGGKRHAQRMGASGDGVKARVALAVLTSHPRRAERGRPREHRERHGKWGERRKKRVGRPSGHVGRPRESSAALLPFEERLDEQGRRPWS